MKTSLVFVAAALLVGCDAFWASPPAEWQPIHADYVGPYEVIVSDASLEGFDYEAFDTSLVIAVDHLRSIYPMDGIEHMLRNTQVVVQDAPIPCDSDTGKCKGIFRPNQAIGRVMRIHVSLYYGRGCDAATAIAHELAHMMRLHNEAPADDASDPDHHDTRFFPDRCDSDACRSATVEERSLRDGRALCSGK